MTNEQITRTIAAHDRQLDVIVATLASLAERLKQLTDLAELQNKRLTRLEDEQS
jgi:mRNA degradation ribonuclease J1/J2